MNGRFNIESDDTYTYFKAKACGKASNLVSPVIHREPGLNHNKLNYQFCTGKLDYKIGYDPIHILSWIRLKNFSLIRFLGYFYSLFTFKKGFDFAKSERSKYLSLILRKLKL